MRALSHHNNTHTQLHTTTHKGFVAASFANGIFGVVAPIGTAYIGDVYSDDPQKAEEAMGGLMALQMMGGGLGGIIAILTKDMG